MASKLNPTPAPGSTEYATHPGADDSEGEDEPMSTLKKEENFIEPNHQFSGDI